MMMMTKMTKTKIKICKNKKLNTNFDQLIYNTYN